MVTIIFESHATTKDNEAQLASGHNDVDLSEGGVRQAGELGRRYLDQQFAAIYCSDMKRAYRTAELAFGDKFPIIRDSRLRECDYGDYTQNSKFEVDAQKVQRINVPFPNGESYSEVTERMKFFLADLMPDYDGKTVMVIGHRATQYGLEHWVNGVSILDAVSAPWAWQPGWEYHLAKMPGS